MRTHTESAKRTTDHETIRHWAEERGGKPATVNTTGKADAPGLLRIDFPGHSGEETLQEVTWEKFFEKFEEANLAMLYQDSTAEGQTSRFCKLVDRDRDDD